ncbi:MAG: matrixin family metalloprotease [Litorimonas sp.]
MKTKLLLCSALLTAFGANAIAQTQTGRQLDIIATDASLAPAPLPSIGDDTALFLERPIVGIFWDERCASVEYTFNSNVGANPGTPNEISPEELAGIVQTGLDRWNDNPSSYIDMNITNITDLGARPRIGGDFINEVTFITAPGFGALASSPSFSLVQDQTFAVGDDLDGDGDSDVFDPVAADNNTCFDFDGDGDIEFPAGDYAAGTILDNDVQFGAAVLWETTPTNGGGADVDAVSTHEFGHSHGLSHAITNQTGDNDGTSSTMFPFISTAEANSEIAQRTPNPDDLSASAHIYQEGNGTTPISEIQPGDIAFDEAYGLITGTVSTSAETPLTSAAVKAIDFRSQSVAAQVYSGQTSAFETPTGGLVALPESAVNGDYVLPVLRDSLYTVEIEALDGVPVATGNISTGAIISGILGLNQFPDEAVRRGVTERAVELEPLRASLISIRGSNSESNLDIIANSETIQRNSGPQAFVGTGAIFGANDIIYAEMFGRDEVSQLLAAGFEPVSGGAETNLFGEDASTAIFSDAQLAIGTVDPATGIVDITQVLSSEEDVAGQDDDTATFAFNGTRALPFQIRRAFNADPNAQLFFLLELNDVEIGPNAGFPLAFVGLDPATIGSSFLSTNEGPISFFGSGWAMELRYVNRGARVSSFLTRF